MVALAVSVSCGSNGAVTLLCLIPLLYPQKKLFCSDVPQILSRQGVDLTPLLSRCEGVVMTMKCNFYRLKLLVFTNN